MCSVSISGRTVPRRPFSPPVTEVQRRQMPQTIMPSASVRHTPEMNSRYTGYVMISPNGSVPDSKAGASTPWTSSPTMMLRNSSNTKIRP